MVGAAAKPLLPFFTYYGGKWRAAPRYPAPTFGRIVEPFAGAAGYAVRHYTKDVVLIDKDPKIIALWRYLIAATPKDILALPAVEPGQSVDDLDVSLAAKTLIGFWLNKGSASPCKTPSKWMRDGMRPNSFWGEAIRARIASQVDKIKHWTAIEGDYTASPRGMATWFVDPPYREAGKLYRHSSTAIDFAHLGMWCKSLSGQVLVCENEGADWLDFKPHLTIKASPSKTGGKRSHEVLWVGP